MGLYYTVMAKFVSVLGIVLLALVALSLLWPRISPYPRPEPLTRLHNILVATPIGENAANVLGVSDEAQVVPLTPQTIVQSILDSVKTRVTDVLITHAVRGIMSRFSQLSPGEQTRILDAISQSMNASSSGISTVSGQMNTK
jgi:hypothetical protein